MWQIYPCRTAISQIFIPIQRAHIWPIRCGRSTPCRTAISRILIPILTAHIWPDQVWQIYPHAIEWQFHRFWFLFWHFIFDWPGVADLPPPHRMAISQILIPILTAHIWQTRVADLPHVEQQFHRFWFLFWQLIFGRPGVADLLPPNRMAISQILIPILTLHIWLTRCGRSTPTQ